MTSNPRAACRHVYVTSDGICFHCGEDVSAALQGAVARLSEAIDAELSGSRDAEL